MGKPQDRSYEKRTPRMKSIKRIGAIRENPNPNNPARKNYTHRPLHPKRNRKDRNCNGERKIRPIPIERKGTDTGYKIQGYTERPCGRPCILYPLSLCWSLPIGKGRGVEWVWRSYRPPGRWQGRGGREANKPRKSPKNKILFAFYGYFNYLYISYLKW